MSFELFGTSYGYLATLRALGRRGGGVRNGTERNGSYLFARDSTPLVEEVTGSKRPDIIGPGQLALGWWVRWGGGMGTGSEGEGGGVFFTAELC